MKTCPFCKEDVKEDAVKCRHCQSLLVPVNSLSGQDDNRDITYVLDKDLVRFGKFAIGVLGVFTIVGLFLFGYRLSDMARQLSDAQQSLSESQDNLTAAQAEMDAGLERLNETSDHVETLQVRTEDIKKRAEEAFANISQRERRSRELLVAMETASGGTVIETRISEARTDSVRGRLWPNGSVLRIALSGGDEAVRETLKSTAVEWVSHANLEFDFVGETAEADLQVSFVSGEGSWSYVGTDAQEVVGNTMNLDPRLSKEEFRRQVLVQFGHAIGLLKEHQNPSAEIPWNKDAVYEHFTDVYGWTHERVEQNLFRKWPKDAYPLDKPYDRKSIMHHPIKNEWTLGDFSVDATTEVSEGDKEWVDRLYPQTEPGDVQP